MTRRSLLILLIILNLAALITGVILVFNDPLFLSVRSMASAYKIITENYVEQIDPEDLFYASLSSMKESLDPFTGYFPPRVFKYYEEESQGEFYGIGVEITVRDGLLTVISPIAGTPADEAGLRAGDQVTMIGDIDASTLDPDEAVELIRGQPGSIVELKIRRPGLKDEFSVKISRAAIKLTSVDFAGLVDSIGYVRLTRFALTSYAELFEALDSLKAAGMESLVLDLRGNPGGFLEIAVAITGLFLPQDALIVSTGGRSFIEDFDIRNFMEGEFQDIPMVVLVNGGSASASEILSGALQDYDRAVIVGDTTFGKGLVQNISELAGGGALRVTVSKYYLPSGRIIQKFSDQERSRNVSYSQEQVEKTYKTLGGREVYGGGGIVPDIIIHEDQPGLLEVVLAYGGFYFDFAVEYLQDHREEFRLPLDESVLEKFKAYLVENGIVLPNELAVTFDDFVQQAREDSAGSLDSQIIGRVNRKIEAAAQDFWAEDKDIIDRELSRALARLVYSRPNLYRKYDLLYDPQIRLALNLLTDSKRYNDILRSGE
jgi:carboxyl-terminal processing protease